MFFFLFWKTAKKRETSPDYDLPPLEENLNRAIPDSLEARTVDEALSLLRYVEKNIMIQIRK